MTKLFNDSHQFKLADEFDMGIKYPIIIESENSDGSVTGKFDIDQMSTVKKDLSFRRILILYNSEVTRASPLFFCYDMYILQI